MQFGKTYTREFFKDLKLHSSFGLVQFRSSLKNSLVHVFFQIALETILLPILNDTYGFFCIYNTENFATWSITVARALIGGGGGGGVYSYIRVLPD